MAPIKFEEQLKDKLEKRSLPPSADSWAKLSERLDGEDKRSKKPVYWWLSIAAMLVVLIAITVQVFNNEESTSVSPKIVNEELNEIKTDDNKVITKSNDTKLANEDTSVDIQNEEKIQTNVIEIIKTKTSKTTKQNEQLASNTIKVKNTSNVNTPKATTDVLINQPEIDKTAVAQLLESSDEIKDLQLNREVDSLLKAANKELFKDKLLKESNNTVDANTLLMSVEDEMGQSFRSKVYEALKDSYQTVKTAVAQRNN